MVLTVLRVGFKFTSFAGRRDRATVRIPSRLQILLHQRLDAPGLYRCHQRRVVANRPVGVCQREFSQGQVEYIRFAEIAADHCRIAGPRVGPGEYRPAQSRIDL